MKPSRLTIARQNAGLSIAQAVRLLGWPRSQELLDLEVGDREFRASPAEVQAQIAALYGVTVEWLLGADPELPAATREVLRRIESRRDRESLTELIASLTPIRPRSER